MNRRERAILAFIILLLLWATILTGPFKSFSLMTRELGFFILARLGLGGNLQIFITYLICIVFMIGLFTFNRSKNRGLVAAVCAIASLFFYLIQAKTFQTVPVYIAVALTLVILSIVIKSDVFSLWLTDLFILSIPVMILYDAFFVPLFAFMKIDTAILAPWIDIQKNSLFSSVSLFGWPVLVWGVIVTAAAFIPAIFFISSKNRGR
ncbi:MAG: hypothetical protein ACYCYI_03560 [Saccharofermentanales bacterium]